MTKTYSIKTIEDYSRVIVDVHNIVKPGIRVGLNGQLGAGKTTFVQQLLKKLGVAEKVTSPTYVIHKSYQSKELSIEHLDLYRLEGQKLEDLPDLAEILTSTSSLVLVEWPSYVSGVNQLLDNTLDITVLPTDEREVTLSTYEA